LSLDLHQGEKFWVVLGKSGSGKSVFDLKIDGGASQARIKGQYLKVLWHKEVSQLKT